jgi:hypothetical protein
LHQHFEEFLVNFVVVCICFSAYANLCRNELSLATTHKHIYNNIKPNSIARKPRESTCLTTHLIAQLIAQLIARHSARRRHTKSAWTAKGQVQFGNRISVL